MAVTDHIVSYPCCPIDIAQDHVDFVVEVDSIGDPNGILSGTTRPTSDPVGLEIAAAASAVIEASGLLVDGFSTSCARRPPAERQHRRPTWESTAASA